MYENLEISDIYTKGIMGGNFSPIWQIYAHFARKNGKNDNFC